MSYVRFSLNGDKGQVADLLPAGCLIYCAKYTNLSNTLNRYFINKRNFINTKSIIVYFWKPFQYPYGRGSPTSTLFVLKVIIANDSFHN